MGRMSRVWCGSSARRVTIHLVNLHGDLSILALVHALDYVQAVHQTHAATTTSLVNLSLGTYIYDEALHASVRALDTTGIPIIASAGNDNTSKPFYPAAFPEVLGVCSSTRHTRVKAAYSNFGPWVSLCAPGLQYVTRPLQPGDIASGTSFASPMVAGALGQLLLDAPCASPRAGLRALRRTADPPAENQPALGAGILNAPLPASICAVSTPARARQVCGSAGSPGCSAWAPAWRRMSA